MLFLAGEVALIFLYFAKLCFAKGAVTYHITFCLFGPLAGLSKSVSAPHRSLLTQSGTDVIVPWHPRRRRCGVFAICTQYEMIAVFQFAISGLNSPSA